MSYSSGLADLYLYWRSLGSPQSLFLDCNYFVFRDTGRLIGYPTHSAVVVLGPSDAQLDLLGNV